MKNIKDKNDCISPDFSITLTFTELRLYEEFTFIEVEKNYIHERWDIMIDKEYLVKYNFNKIIAKELNLENIKDSFNEIEDIIGIVNEDKTITFYFYK